ncbi:ras guanine nucleotide exchange factor domain-containing protein [Gorgonomyces haynaldii]|nr:ras guanine nucleotide exchange factor domain-containing protein [Gorgonomyces haynaldii]
MQSSTSKAKEALFARLPKDINDMRDLVVDLLIHQNLFEERCKDALKQVLEEKHTALYKVRLLEEAAGLENGDEETNFIEQLQRLQEQEERNLATINYQKLRIKTMEKAAEEQELYYNQSLLEHVKNNEKDLKMYKERAEKAETELQGILKMIVKQGNQAFGLSLPTTPLPTDVLSAPASAPQSAPVLSTTAPQLPVAEQVITKRGTSVKKVDTSAPRLSAVDKSKTSATPSTAKDSAEPKTAEPIARKLPLLPNDTSMKPSASTGSFTVDMPHKENALGELIIATSEAGQIYVKSGHIPRLMERLVDPNGYDNQFMQTFLMTYPVYTKAEALLEHVIKVCRNLSDKNSGTNTAVLLRSINLLKHWVEQYWSDFESDPGLLETLETFLNTMNNEKLAQQVKSVIRKKTIGVDYNTGDTSNYPKPILPKGAKLTSESPESKKTPNKDVRKSFLQLAFTAPVENCWKLAELDPLEVARQLTLMEYDMFQSIKKPRELLDCNWMKEDKEVLAPNIIRMVRWSNHVVEWLVTEIVTIRDNIKARALMMEKIIQMAQHLEKLNNFNGVKEVLAAMQSSPVYRLKKTKETMASKYLKILETLKKLTGSESNYKLLRAKVHSVDPPLIPFPGVYQGDLVYLEGYGKDILDDGMVNFQKFQKVSSYVTELQTYQHVPYQLTPVPEIQAMIKNYPAFNDDQAYNMSLVCEPRE